MPDAGRESSCLGLFVSSETADLSRRITVIDMGIPWDERDCHDVQIRRHN
jgi:hypothetical protein